MSRRPRRRHAELAAGVLNRMLRRSGLYEGLRERRALTLWPEVVGSALARVTEPRYLREGTLVVCVSGSSWRAELHHLLPEILAKLNRRLDRPLREIRLVTGKLSSKAEGSTRGPGVRPRPVLGEADISLEQLIDRARSAARRRAQQDPDRGD